MGGVLRRLVDKESYTVAPGVANALYARVVEKVGFKAMYMTGYGTSLNFLGLTDIGLLTASEMIENARYISNAVKVPVIADADNGYGNAINVMRTVREYERAGVAGIHIEDQTFPKRCGHLLGKQVIPLKEAVGKIRAALDARVSEEFMIIARTDAIGALGGSMEEGIKRAYAYAEAGADMVFAEFTSTSAKEAENFSDLFRRSWPDVHMVFNYSPSFKWYKSSPLPFKYLGELGYRLIILPLATVRPSMKAAWDYLLELKQREEVAENNFERNLEGHPTEDFHEFGGLSEVKLLESRYLAEAQSENRL